MRSIRFENVTKHFPGGVRPAVEACSFSVAGGTLAVLMGPSGSGKTTLLKMVNRLIEPTSGQVFIDSTGVRQLEMTALRRQIGYVIQQIGLFPHMTVAGNIAIVPELLGWKKERIRERVDELLELVSLPPGEYCGRFPAQLSGGQQQRVGLARALAADPEILLMDEPFGALDALTRRGLQEELLRLQQRLRKTILFVTHDVEEALRLADRIAVVCAGRVIQEDTPLDLLTRPRDRIVYDLMGAEDVMRRLSLVPALTLAANWAGSGENRPVSQRTGGLPAFSGKDDLRSALSLLLGSGAPALSIVQDGREIGILTLDDIQRVARGGGD